MGPDRPVSRRTFLTWSGGATLAGVGAALLPARRAAAARVGMNDKVRIAIVGTGNMGSRHVEALAVNPNCSIAAVCDVGVSRYKKAQEKIKELSGLDVDGYQDFRRVLERKDIDAFWVATPDHWHPLLTILGCEAGKDVYVEKPACTTIEEGRAMVTAARRHGRIVQLGTQQRSMPVFQEAMKVVHGGGIGTVTSATAWIGTNGWSVGETPEDVPRGLDWDLWLGPAPWTPYSPQRYFGFMGWHDYARGGQLTNWGVHLMDVVHWGIREDRPLAVSAIGGSYREGAGGDNFENIEAIFEYKGCNVTWQQRHHDEFENKGGGIKFYGTEGTLVVDRATYIVRPDSLGIKEYIGEPEKSWAYPPHHDNFLNSVRTRQLPVADIEQGFRSTTAPLLAGIALKVRRRLEWDGTKEQFIHDDEANRYLTRTYRAPWHL